MLTKKQLKDLNLLSHPTLAGTVSGYVTAEAVQTALAEIEALQTTIGDLQEQNLQAAMEAAEWKCRAMTAETETTRLRALHADIVGELYGQGFEVAGFHLNGNLEKLDRWFEDNNWLDAWKPAEATE